MSVKVISSERSKMACATISQFLSAALSLGRFADTHKLVTLSICCAVDLKCYVSVLKIIVERTSYVTTLNSNLVDKFYLYITCYILNKVILYH